MYCYAVNLNSQSYNPLFAFRRLSQIDYDNHYPRNMIYAALSPLLVRYSFTWPSAHNTSSPKANLPEAIKKALMDVARVNIPPSGMSLADFEHACQNKFSSTRLPKQVDAGRVHFILGHDYYK